VISFEIPQSVRECIKTYAIDAYDGIRVFRLSRLPFPWLFGFEIFLAVVGKATSDCANKSVSLGRSNIRSTDRTFYR